MKRIVVSICFLVLLSQSHAQVYVRVNAGYNIPISSSLIGYEEHYDGAKATTKGVYGSYGKGFSANVAFGGMFKNGVLGYDLEVGYLVGKEYSSTSDYSSQAYESTYEQVIGAKSIQIAPSLSFTVGTKKLQPFARMGPVIAITTLKGEETSTANYTYDYSTKYKYTGSVSLGFKGVVGVSYAINERVQIFTEMNFISMSYAPNKREITEFEVDGVDRMDDLDPEQIEVDIEDEYTTEGEENEPPIKEFYSMGSIGLQFGAKFTF
jgi:hypothetical protein